MIPFATWSQSKGDLEATGSEETPGQPDNLVSDDLAAELSGLTDAIIDNLMTSNVADLRHALESLGMSWCERQTKQQEKCLKLELARVEETIMSAVADVLMPILTELQLKKVLKEFTSTLQTLLPELGNQNLVIKAPSDVHEMLSQTLHHQAISAEIVDTESRDISISGNQVVLVANLDAWSHKLRELVNQ